VTFHDVSFSTRLEPGSPSHDSTVKIWDTSSGECLQTLGIDKTLSNISFDTTGSCLHTEIGTVNIGASPASNTTPNVADPQNPRYQGWFLSSDGAWITYNPMTRVWQPSEYRPSGSCISGTYALEISNPKPQNARCRSDVAKLTSQSQ
jgi:hypothetical protein